MSKKSINFNLIGSGQEPVVTHSVNVVKQSNIDELGDAIEKWLLYCKADTLSEQTIIDYRVFISKFHWWYTEYRQLPSHPRNMTTDRAMEFIAYLKTNQSYRWGEPVKPGKEKLSPASVATYARTVRTFFNWMQVKKIIEQNPFNREIKITSKKDPIVGKHHKNLQIEQLSKIFEYMTRPERMALYNGARDLAIVSLLLDSGMRRGELLSMKVEDIDWMQKRVQIRGKTGERTCFYTQSVEEALTLYHDNHRKRQKELLTPSSPYWLTSEGNPLTSRGLGSALLQMSKSCGVTFSAHKFRHTFASTMVSRVGLYELKELLGHSSLATTLIYTHGSPDKLQDTYRGNSPLSILDVGQLKAKPRRGRPRREQ